MILMGCRFDITVVSEDEDKADKYIELAVERIHNIEGIVSSWLPDSQTALINKNAGIKPVMVDDELYRLIKRAKTVSGITDGAFDISYASMDKIWKFDGSMKSLPLVEDIAGSVEKVGYENIILNENDKSVFLRKKGMKINFGGIGKGYAADQAKALLIEHGVEAGIINASGDLSAWGKQPDGSSWKVAITNPLNKNKQFAVLPVDNRAIVTSGDYERYVELEGKRYSHIIDPRTYYPATGIVSVSVIAENAELADALATAIFVMGVDAGIDRINQLDKVDCIIVDDKGNVFHSEDIRINEDEKF